VQRKFIQPVFTNQIWAYLNAALKKRKLTERSFMLTSQKVIDQPSLKLLLGKRYQSI
jgi:hypothetical protein